VGDFWSRLLRYSVVPATYLEREISTEIDVNRTQQSFLQLTYLVGIDIKEFSQ